ncbi:MAG TPA: DNA polymerase/3'-5' exonuclease PolX [Phycisphaerae bacterium]|jgi:DNA polymerase (family 10)|nr:DNA polymerase/3'-5' exonuclease PolX [Phycisphaerae bacterium]
MKNQEIAAVFEKAADILALLDENSFRVLALRKVARAIEEMPSSIESAAAENTLESFPGIGKSSAERIREYLKSGKIAEFEELTAQVPPGVLEIMRIPTVGPKTASLLWREGGVTTVAQLMTEIEMGDKSPLLKIKGVGAKKLSKMKENLAHVAASSGRVRLGDALPIAEELVDFLRTLPGVQQVQYCGSLRRGKETIGDIDIAVAAPLEKGLAIGEAVTKHPKCSAVIQLGESKTSIRASARFNIQVDVRVVPPESFGAAIQYFTGSKEHNVKLRERAIKMGMKVNEWGVYQIHGDKETRVAGDTEEGVYAALGHQWMPPEMREGWGELDAAKLDASKAEKPAGKSRSKIENQKSKIDLVELADIRGDLHTHTTASDGSCTIEEMVAEAKRRGYQYIAITDHSKSQFQANGLKSDRLLEHIAAIHAVAKQADKGPQPILVLAGSEVDILADGSLDYEDELLAKLDWVVASPHAALTQETDPATARLVRAASNPFVTVMGHPTGRIVPSRRGLEPDMSKVIFAAVRAGTAMEINANYHRLDLRDIHVKMAVDAKVPICINTDAHGLVDFDQMRYGIMTARRGWAAKANILNTKTRDELQKWLKERKAAAAW